MASPSRESFRWYRGPAQTGTIARADREGSGDYGAVMSDRPAPTTPARRDDPDAQSRRRRPAPPRRLGLFVTIAFTVVSLVSLALPAATLAWSPNSFSSASEQELLARTNQARASAGRRTLRWDSALASIARWRSKDMIKRGYFSHDIPGAGNVFDEMSARGYCYKVAGENIGWNTYPDDVATAQIQQAFMGSSGHRANILGRDWDHIGIGAYKGSNGKKMWTVLFADKCGSSGPVASKPKPKAQPKPATTKPKATARPKPKPKPTPSSTPAPTATPVDQLARVGGPDAVGGSAGSGRGPDPRTATSVASSGVGLRVVDRPSGGLLESIVGGVAGFFGG